jgi:hypothetical protein
MFVVLVVVVAINVVPLTQFWYKHTMHPHVLHVSVYYSHHQCWAGLTELPFFLSATSLYTAQCLHIGTVIYKYVIYVLPLCYKILIYSN